MLTRPKTHGSAIRVLAHVAGPAEAGPSLNTTVVHDCVTSDLGQFVEPAISPDNTVPQIRFALSGAVYTRRVTRKGAVYYQRITPAIIG